MTDGAVTPGDALLQQAQEQMETGDLEQAVESFSAVLAVSPQQVQALRGRGRAYQQLKRWESAVEDFRRVRSLAPEDFDAWVDLGSSLANSNQMYPALEVFDTLLVRHPAFARAHLEVGLVHLRLGAIAKAKEHFTKALACRPTPPQRQFIQNLLAEQGRLDGKRYYRPDFEALRRQQQDVAQDSWVTGLFRSVRRIFRRGGA